MKYRRARLNPQERRAQRRAVAVLPTLFTLGNAICGFAALHYAAKGSIGSAGAAVGGDITRHLMDYATSGYFIFAAMIFDVFDGFLARLTRNTSEFGAELDSLADVISFGVAPAFLALQVIADVYRPGLPPGLEVLGPNADDLFGKLFWIIGAIYVACTALRLARYNVIATDNKDEFKGLPSPGAAAVVAASVIFFITIQSGRHYIPFNVPPGVTAFATTIFPYAMPMLLLCAALLMVSRVAYPHLVNRYLRGGRRFSYVSRIAIVGLLLLWQAQITALICVYIYAASAPTLWAWRRLMGRRRPPREPGARGGPAIEPTQVQPTRAP